MVDKIQIDKYLFSVYSVFVTELFMECIMKPDSLIASPLSLFHCDFCDKFVGNGADIPLDFTDSYALAAVLSGSVRVAENNKFLTLSQNTYALFDGDKITLSAQPESTFFLLRFSGPLSLLLRSLKLSRSLSYPLSGEQAALFESVLSEYRQDIETASDVLFTSRLFEFLSLSARVLYNLHVPASVVGINGFSVENVATREEGMFHGRQCIKITPNRSIQTIIVLENFDMEIYHLNPLQYRVIQMQYYYESRGTRHIEGRFRTLSCLDEDDPEKKTVFIDRHGDYPFVAPLRRNRWLSTFFTIRYPQSILDILAKMRRPVLRQVKLDPFGVIDASSIDDGDIMYISSITFYSVAAGGTLSDTAPVEAVCRLIDEHYRQDLPLSFYADACHLSVRHLINRFTSEIGVSPHQYILQKRVRHARAYLLDDKPIAEVAQASGFTDPHYFSRVFKKHTGMTPSEYRVSAKKSTEESQK